MAFLQDRIHQFEEGGGMRYVRWGILALLLLSLLLGYNYRAFRNFGTAEAMDSAQLARNIAEGKGYTTSFVRPFSIYLVKKRNIQQQRNLTDFAQLKTEHPDIANPPLYPVLLAGVMKVFPFFDYSVFEKGGFWSPNGRLVRFQPDFIISLFNQFLFFLLIFLVFKLTKKLFDAQVAWLSTVALLTTELLWRFSVSGLSTMTLLLIFVGLGWVLVRAQELGDSTDELAAGQPAGQRPAVAVPSVQTGPGRQVVLLGFLAGTLVGFGALTRYSFLLVIIPVLAYLVIFLRRQRAQAALAALAGCFLLVIPWIMRNYDVSGSPFGTTAYAFISNHPIQYLFPGNRLERSLEPNLANPDIWFSAWHKIFVNLRTLLQSDLPRLGGTWLSAFFLVGLLMPFNRQGTRRLRYFLLACIPLFILAQTLGRTHLSEDSPDVNTENMLVLLTPFVVVYGTSLFVLLLDNLPLPAPELRYGVIGIFVGLVSLPMLLVFLPPRTEPLVYPPYDPTSIQVAAAEIKPGELLMSDMPWATAWYGRRQSVWLTLNPMPDAGDPSSQENLVAIHDYIKPISELYLSPFTIDRRFVSQWFASGDKNWGGFVITILIEKQVPPIFPLRNPCDLFGLQPHLAVSEGVRTAERRLNAKIELLDKAVQEMLTDPKLAEAVANSDKAKTFLQLTERREFPLGRVPTPDPAAGPRILESMISRGHLVLTEWERTPVRPQTK